MSDPKNIKDQSSISSGDVTPEEASKGLDQINEEELGKVSGGTLERIANPYADCL
jgi:hypothetical protein